VAIPDVAGGVPDPDRLVTELAVARANGADPRLMVITAPDNPTGTTAPPHLVQRLAAIAEQEDLLVIADEIYRDVLFDGQPYTSAADQAPDRVVVVTGLSKSLSLGGWRIGAARFPVTGEGRMLGRAVTAVASQVWSNMPGPMQAVAELAFSEPAPIVAHREASTRLHATVARAVHAAFADGGALVRRPTGGFYVYPDLAPLRPQLAAVGVHGSADLERHLLGAFGIAVLGGHHCGDDPRALRFRVATSLLYGRTEDQRAAALRADDPTRLAHIAAALDRIRAVLPMIRQGS
jgi:aspartate aminotransferase